MDSKSRTRKELTQEIIKIANAYEKHASIKTRILMSVLVVMVGVLISNIVTYVQKPSDGDLIHIVLSTMIPLWACISLIYSFIIIVYRKRKSLFSVKSDLIQVTEMELLIKIESSIDARLKREIA
jgi:hypothetical protein